jgi:hypothetical protein
MSATSPACSRATTLSAAVQVGQGEKIGAPVEGVQRLFARLQSRRELPLPALGLPQHHVNFAEQNALLRLVAEVGQRLQHLCAGLGVVVGAHRHPPEVEMFECDLSSAAFVEGGFEGFLVKMAGRVDFPGPVFVRFGKAGVGVVVAHPGLGFELVSLSGRQNGLGKQFLARLNHAQLVEHFNGLGGVAQVGSQPQRLVLHGTGLASPVGVDEQESQVGEHLQSAALGIGVGVRCGTAAEVFGRPVEPPLVAVPGTQQLFHKAKGKWLRVCLVVLLKGIGVVEQAVATDHLEGESELEKRFRPGLGPGLGQYLPQTVGVAKRVLGQATNGPQQPQAGPKKTSVLH